MCEFVTLKQLIGWTPVELECSKFIYVVLGEKCFADIFITVKEEALFIKGIHFEFLLEKIHLN